MERSHSPTPSVPKIIKGNVTGSPRRFSSPRVNSPKRLKPRPLDLKANVIRGHGPSPRPCETCGNPTTEWWSPRQSKGGVTIYQCDGCFTTKHKEVKVTA